MKTREQEQARALRVQHGLSIREIERLLGVSKSSESRWVRDIELTREQLRRLDRRNPIHNQQRNGSAANAQRARGRRAEFQEEGRRRAREADWSYTAGCMLYWAEGEKSRNAVRFSNSDPEMMRFFIAFLRTLSE